MIGFIGNGIEVRSVPDYMMGDRDYIVFESLMLVHMKRDFYNKYVAELEGISVLQLCINRIKSVQIYESKFFNSLNNNLNFS